MRATAILAIIAIVAALGAVTSLIPIHQVSAQGNPFKKFPGGGESSSPCGKKHAGEAGIQTVGQASALERKVVLARPSLLAEIRS